MQNIFDLTGRVAVVTGATGSLGSALCRGLAHAGARVAALARTAEATATLAASLDGGAIGVTADVLDGDSLRRAAVAVATACGRVDILVNAAGGNRPEATAVPGVRTFFDIDPAAIEAVVALNLHGTILPTQVFGRSMAVAGSGAIINISSMAAFTPLTRVIGYAAAKAAVNNFTAWLAVEMAREHGSAIRVNAIAPGFFLGEQNRYLLIDSESGALTPRGEQIIAHTPMGRFGEPDDLIGALVWLASDAARFVTGIVVPVDGGFSAYSGV